MSVLLSKALPRIIRAMSGTTFFAVAWLLIGLAWAYRSVTRKEYRQQRKPQRDEQPRMFFRFCGSN